MNLVVPVLVRQSDIIERHITKRSTNQIAGNSLFSSEIILIHNILKKQLEQLNTKGHEVLVRRDLNENLLKYNEDKQTSEYLDMLLTLGFMPIITKPTRITDQYSAQ